MHNQSDNTEQQVAKLNAELNEWSMGIRCVFLALNTLPLYFCSRTLMAAPKFEHIFEDMLGSKDKLPTTTRFVLEWSMPMLGMIWLLTALTVFLIFTIKSPRYVWITAAVSAFILTASGLFLSRFSSIH